MKNAITLISLLVLLFTIAPVQALTTTIPDYPRYGTDPSPFQKDELRRTAVAVVGTLLTGAQIDVSIYGHADFDAQGSDFEIKVSTERAQAAVAAFIALLKEEAAKVQMPDPRLQSIQYLVAGIGTIRPVFANPGNEEERKANRRVEFVWNVSLPQMPEQESVFERCNRVLTGATPPGPVRRMTCACTNFLRPSPRMQDTHYDFRARSAIPGSAGMPNLTPEQWDAAIKGIVRHMRQDIVKSSDGFSDPEFVSNLMSLDDTVGRNINDFFSQSVGDSATGYFDRIIIADIRARMLDPNHAYSCYAGYSRANHDK